MKSRATRAAENEALFREANERIEATAAGFGSHRIEALCECSDPRCTRTITLTIAEYREVRSEGDRFAMVQGHDDPAVERIVEETERFVVAEKLGEGREVARKLDPRG